MGFLWPGLIGTWCCLGGSRHSLTFPLDLDTSTKLLHQPAVSPIPSGVMMFGCCSHSNSSLKGFCSKQATLSGAPGMGCCLVLPEMKTFHQSIPFC